MRVLLNGAGGYIGFVLAGRLASSGCNVVCLDRFLFGEDILSSVADKTKFVRDDIRTSHPSITYGVDEVLDIASLSSDHSGDLGHNKTPEVNYKCGAKGSESSKSMCKTMSARLTPSATPQTETGDNVYEVVPN